jgi:hypothetical protein
MRIPKSFIAYLHTIAGKDTWLVEFFVALELLFWSVLETVAPAHNLKHSFYPLLEVLSEPGWEHLSFFIGVLQFISVLIHNRLMRSLSAAMAMWMMGTLAGCFIMTHPYATGVLNFYLVAVIINFWAIFKNLKPRTVWELY